MGRGIDNNTAQILANIVRGFGARGPTQNNNIGQPIFQEDIPMVSDDAGKSGQLTLDTLNKTMAQQKKTGGQRIALPGDTVDINAPLREEAKKQAIKRVAQLTNQQMDAGVPPEQILQTVQQNESQALAGTQPQPQQQPGLSKAGQATRNVVGPIGDVLTQLLTLGGRLESPQAASRELAREQSKTLRQEREVGPTAAKREELKTKGLIDLQKELISKGTPDALTPENAGKFNLLIDGADATQTMGDIFLNKDNSLQGLVIENKITPGLMKSQIGKKLESAIERAIQARTRIETGAALQPSELTSTKKRFAPRVGDSPETARQRMKPLADFFNGSLNVADPTGVHRQRAKGSMQSGGVVMVDAQGNRALVDPSTNKVIKEL